MEQKMIKIPSGLASVSGYTASVIMIKGFSILTIPLVARYLEPADYGNLDVASSVVECVGLFAALGLAPSHTKKIHTVCSNELALCFSWAQRKAEERFRC